MCVIKLHCLPRGATRAVVESVLFPGLLFCSCRRGAGSRDCGPCHLESLVAQDDVHF